MSLNPHPIVLATASERHRAELFALAEPVQRRSPALSRAGLGLRSHMRSGARLVSGMLAPQLTRVGEAPSLRAVISAG